MKHEIVIQLHGQFESIARVTAEDGVEFWMARDLQTVLGYQDWRNFVAVIEKAKTACELSGQPVGDHFGDTTRMVDTGSGAQRELDDMALTRYACYLIAQNGDPSKPIIAFAQTYFAVQTRKQELIAQRLDELERIEARGKLTESEKRLSGLIFERVGSGDSFAVIRSKGDQALFGGKSTVDMKRLLGVPDGRPLADFLPTITIKAKDFANEVTNYNIRHRDDLRTETAISADHVKNNHDVRGVLTARGIKPEALPPAEDAQKVRRRLVSDTKKLPKETKKLGNGGNGGAAKKS